MQAKKKRKMRKGKLLLLHPETEEKARITTVNLAWATLNEVPHSWGQPAPNTSVEDAGNTKHVWDKLLPTPLENHFLLIRDWFKFQDRGFEEF